MGLRRSHSTDAVFKAGHVQEDTCSPNTRSAKIYDDFVRDSFYTASLAAKRSASAAQMGVVLSPLPPGNLIRRPVGLDRYYPTGSTTARLYYNPGDSAHYERELEDPFHQHRHWRHTIPPTYAKTFELRYATKAGRTFDTLHPVRWRDYRTWLRVGDHRSNIYWNFRFGDRYTYPPAYKNPWNLTPMHYYYSHTAY
jgi:hypothetical protein